MIPLLVGCLLLSMCYMNGEASKSDLRIFSRQDFLRNTKDLPISSTPHKRGKRHSSTANSDLSYVIKYGYVEPSTLNSNNEVEDQQSLTKAFLEMQRFLDLPLTGRFDSATEQMMRRPRRANKDRTSGMDDLVRKKRYATVGKKWKKLQVTYSINNYTPKVGKSGTHKAIDAAFSVWAKHSQLDFIKVNTDDNPDIVILFAKGDHGDGNAFDGPGGLFVHAYYPGPGIGGDTHFDSEEAWTLNKGPYEGRDLFLVAVHALGHALGLGHSPDATAIMAPVYQYYDTANFRLPQDDIDGIQQLYGVVANPPEPLVRPTTTSRTTMTSTTRRMQTSPRSRPTYRPNSPSTTPPAPDICTAKVDAATFLRNEFYIFSSRYLWRKSKYDMKPRGPFFIGSLWPRLKSGVDAAFEMPLTGDIALIKGDYYYEFRETNLLEGYPKHFSEMRVNGRDFDAGMCWGRNGKTYLFKDGKYWRLSTGVLDDDYPKAMSLWKGVPNDLDAVFVGAGDDGLNHTYFVKENKYWKFHNRLVKVVGEYDNFAHDWLGCEDPTVPTRAPTT